MSEAVLLKKRIRRRDSHTAGRQQVTATPPGHTNHKIRSMAGVLKLLGDENRLAIVWRLSRVRELNVGQLSHLACQSQPAVSHHLSVLRQAGLIECRRQGKHRFYRLSPSGWKRIQQLLRQLASDVDVQQADNGS